MKVNYEAIVRIKISEKVSKLKMEEFCKERNIEDIESYLLNKYKRDLLELFEDEFDYNDVNFKSVAEIESQSVAIRRINNGY